jgi:hypothetical protein
VILEVSILVNDVKSSLEVSRVSTISSAIRKDNMTCFMLIP